MHLYKLSGIESSSDDDDDDDEDILEGDGIQEYGYLFILSLQN